MTPAQILLKRRMALLMPLALGCGLSHGATRNMRIGTYALSTMKAMKGLTFPRVLLYNSSRQLVPRDSWPAALNAVKAVAGDAFCCVSDKPTPPGHLGPPPDCRVVVYGENLAEHFQGLQDQHGNPLTYGDLPAHEYLIVEYHAAWCAPCIPARKALETFLASPGGRSYAALVIDFTKLATA